MTDTISSSMERVRPCWINVVLQYYYIVKWFDISATVFRTEADRQLEIDGIRRNSVVLGRTLTRLSPRYHLTHDAMASTVQSHQLYNCEKRFRIEIITTVICKYHGNFDNGSLQLIPQIPVSNGY